MDYFEAKYKRKMFMKAMRLQLCHLLSTNGYKKCFATSSQSKVLESWLVEKLDN